MIKWLIKSTNEVRIETKTDVDIFHKEVEQQAEAMGATLSSWSEAQKQKTAKGEVLEEWYIVKYVFVFNNPKDPEKPLRSVSYDLIDNFAELNQEDNLD